MNTKPKFLQIAFVVALVIVTNLFFHYAIALVYPEPKFESFCPVRNDAYPTAELCAANGGQWSSFNYAPADATKAVQAGQPLGWCDPNFTCNKNYTDAHSIYNRNVFGVLIVLSLVVLVIGVFAPIEVLSLGFSWAGVVSLVIASFQYWSDAENWMRVVILAVALGALVWLAVKKFAVDKNTGKG